MQRFRNILLVYDGTEQGKSTLNRAVNLTTRNQARLTIIDVIEEIPRDYQMLITTLLPQEIMELAVKKQNERFEQYITPLLEAGLRVKAKVLVGKEFIEIIREVLHNNHDLVIKTARGKGGVRDILFGSTAMHLMRKCPCPVWMMKPGQGQRYGRIMAAVDVVPPEVEENDLNNKIMEMATSLARTEKSELHVVHAWEKPEASLWVGGLDYYSGDIDKLLNNTKNMHVKWLDDFLGQYDLQHLVRHKHVLQGWADDVIVEFSEQHQVDLIVMGTVCRTGIPGFFIGNTAEKILHSIDCSVLAVKPDGFISPVLLDD